MKPVTRAVLCACAFGLMSAPAFAQEPLARGFFNVNFGVQASSRDLDEGASFTLYEETGTVEGTRQVGAGPVIDLSAGAKVWKYVFVGVGYSRYSDKADLTLDARVPDPLHFDRPRAATLTLPGAKHTEQAVHAQVLVYFELAEKFDIMVGGGPSFYSLSQDVLGEVTAIEGATLSVTGTTISASESAVGYNVGADATYMITERMGVGAFARYAGATVEMPAGEGVTRDVKVGGFQVGAGLRIRF